MFLTLRNLNLNTEEFLTQGNCGDYCFKLLYFRITYCTAIVFRESSLPSYFWGSLKAPQMCLMNSLLSMFNFVFCPILTAREAIQNIMPPTITIARGIGMIRIKLGLFRKLHM